MPSFDEKVKAVIPSDFMMIAGADDSEESQEAYNVDAFELPSPNGKAGGLCTSALLQVLYESPHLVGKMSWVNILKELRKTFKEMGYVQEPQLSSSRSIDPNEPMYIVPPGSGRRRALLIGINYVGQQGELKACHSDCMNVVEYLEKVQGFDRSQMLILCDDGEHQSPTKENIENGFKLLTMYSQPGDVVFVSYSGHGGRVVDTSGDEEDGYDETLIPVDFRTNGQIVDDDILEILVKPMKKDVHTTVLMDCCHSGTVMDLPYTMGADDSKMSREHGFNFDSQQPQEQAMSDKKKTGKAKGEDEDSQNDKKSKKKKDDPDDIPISDIKRPQSCPNDEPPPPPPMVCCQSCAVL